MKGLSSAIKVGILVIVVVALSYGTFKAVSEQASGSDGYRLWGRFHDAGGLVDKSRVVIAGLTVGSIVDRRLDGKFARVTIRVLKETQIWSNAAVYKKSSSLLGEFYLEIDPGTPQSVSAKGDVVENRLLRDNEEITSVLEATSVNDLVTQVSKIVPHVDEVLLEVRDLAADARRVVNGPVASVADNIDRAVAEDKELIKQVLLKADHIADNVDAITTSGRPQVDKILKNVDDLVVSTKREITATGEDVRGKLDRLDRSIDSLQDTLENASDVSKKINAPDQGTLGKLVNDPTIADNVEQITEDVRGFTQGLFGLQTIVGLRVDYNLAEELARAYFSVEIYTKPDKFFLFELVSDPRGDLATTYYVAPDQSLVRSQTIVPAGAKFTLEYGKKFDWLTLRMGFKESTGGFGVDIDPWKDARLKLSVDAFQFTFDDWPRVRLSLAYRFYKYLYVMGGVDDLLNSPTRVRLSGNDITGALPKDYFFGRDPFLGMMIRFSDEDLKSLLLIGGSALIGTAAK